LIFSTNTNRETVAYIDLFILSNAWRHCTVLADIAPPSDGSSDRYDFAGSSAVVLRFRAFADSEDMEIMKLDNAGEKSSKMFLGNYTARYTIYAGNVVNEKTSRERAVKKQQAQET
jgi:hypothetical protein